MTWDHRDPFDRIIAATAITRGLVLVSTDAAFNALTGMPKWLDWSGDEAQAFSCWDIHVREQGAQILQLLRPIFTGKRNIAAGLAVWLAIRDMPDRPAI
jgi:predicted nuclease of predicted toxin-antitoxin system